MPDVLAIHAVPHPDQTVRQVGFPLDHPYVEQCWSPFIGPTCTLLVRRLPLLWREREPAVVPVKDLSRSLGLGTEVRYPESRIWRTVDRLRQFGFASRPQQEVLEVHATVRPLTPRQVKRLPAWIERSHDRLLGEHLDQLARGGAPPVGGTAAAHITARLDRLERPPPLSPTGLAR